MNHVTDYMLYSLYIEMMTAYIVDNNSSYLTGNAFVWLNTLVDEAIRRGINSKEVWKWYKEAEIKANFA